MQKIVIRAVAIIFLGLTVGIIHTDVGHPMHLLTLALGSFLFGYVERILESKGDLA